MNLPPLILIHGYPFDHTMWKPVVAALADKTKVITPDLPGFGDNPVESAEPSIALMADHIAELLELKNLSRAVVAGMSMGGYVALAFAERHKKYLAGLGLVSTQANADTPETQTARRSMIEKVQREGINPAIEAVLPKLFSDANQNNPDMKQYLIDGAQNAGVAGICWALEAMKLRPDRTSVLRTLPVPAAVIHGVEDKIVPAERARQMSGLIPDSKYFELACGHVSPVEAPNDVANALLDLLKRCAISEQSETGKRSPNESGIIIAPSELGL